MKIWIDGYEANVEQRLGSSVIAFELIKNLEKIDHKNEYVILLPSPPLADFPKERAGFRYKIIRFKKLWTKIALPLALYKSREKPDLVFSPTHYIPRFSPVKRIATIFDLSFRHFPGMFNQKDLLQLKAGTKFSATNADHIITISNSSKKDIISEYKVNKNRITVSYPGYDKEEFRIENLELRINKIKEKYKITGKYIIFIGTIQPRKNLIRLIEAVSRIDNLNLIIVGKHRGFGRQGWMFEDILRTPQELGIEDRVKFLGFVPTDDLQSLLNGATAFVLPSLWEGFGIPVLEAMACGTPVLVSNVSSLPEVAGKAGLSFDPYSVDQIEQAIRAIVTDKKLREKYSKEAVDRAKKFSWEKMGKEVLKVFEAVGS